MDQWHKAALSVAVVAALLWGLPWLGRRLAGLLTGLPTVTGPALLAIGLQAGPVALGDAAIGSVAACVPCALFALVQARAGRSVGGAAALGLATLAALLLLPLLWPLEDRLGAALFGAAATLVMCRRAMPRPSMAAAPRRPAWSTLLTVAAAGVVTAAVAWSLPQLGAFWAGVLASPPLLAAIVASQQQRCAGCGAAQAFLSGYLDGLPGRAAFAASLAVLAETLPLPLAFGIALVAALMPTFALRAAATSRRRRETAAPAPNPAARCGR